MLEHVLPNENDYSALWCDLWTAGRTFVLVEWDIVPWPGAVTALLDCPEKWCSYQYPLHKGNLAHSFGINKVDPVGPAPDEWRDIHWARLDGAVLPELQKRLSRPHIHEPAVAHAKAL